MVTKHNCHPGMKETVAACVKNGMNQFLDSYQDDLRDALKQKLVAESDIDAALRGKYRTGLRLGLLDPPSQAPYAQGATTQERGISFDTLWLRVNLSR